MLTRSLTRDIREFALRGLRFRTVRKLRTRMFTLTLPVQHVAPTSIKQVNSQFFMYSVLIQFPNFYPNIKIQLLQEQETSTKYTPFNISIYLDFRDGIVTVWKLE